MLTKSEIPMILLTFTMSDGPYCSRGLPRHWRTVVERAAGQACSDADVKEALEYALRRDYQGLPVALRRSSIFPADDAGGGSFGRVLVEQKQRCANGHPPSLGTDRKALVAGLSAHTASQIRSMAEHSLRKRDVDDTQLIVARLRDVALGYDFNLLADGLRLESRSETRLRRPRKRAGLDEGPQL